MALLIKGKTICPLCGAVIQASDAAIAVPAFLKKSHSLARYSDAAFHKQCFEGSPDAEKVTDLFNKYRQIWEGRPKNLKSREEIDAWGKSAFAEFE